ncbi:nucleoside deaminase [Streptomyces sp. NPDC058426]|uniref:nucleoside deaminase n=1 Tax=Streptomyces sp. NPDC058426 TaxID=3346493 RepID=UPI00365FBD4F
MSAPLTSADRAFLAQAVDLSRESLEAEGLTPFAALIVRGGEVVGVGKSRVVELCDPTAHAEVMAIRDASSRLGRHLLDDTVMYASSEPCPMCLAACYWAQVPKLVFGASTRDVAVNGFEDLQLYRELAHPTRERQLEEVQGDEALSTAARSVLETWAAALPEPVVPKL